MSRKNRPSIAYIRQMVDIALHDLAVRRLVETHLGEWRMAYDEFRGPGSTRLGRLPFMASTMRRHRCPMPS